MKPKPVLECYTQEPGFQEALDRPQAFDDRYLQVEAFFQAKSFKPNTQKRYKRELQRWMAWIDQPWSNTNQETVTRYINYLQHIQTAQSNSTASIASALTALKSFFSWMTKTHQIEQNPAIALTIPSAKASAKAIAHPLAEHELTAIYEILESQENHKLRDTAIVRLLHCGLKPGDIIRLNVGDYNGESLRLRAIRSKANRRVTLSAETVHAIDAYLAEQQQIWNDLGQQDVEPSERPLFISTSAKQAFYGQRLNYHSIYKLVHGLGKLAAVPHCYPERLRGIPDSRNRDTVVL